MNEQKIMHGFLVAIISLLLLTIFWQIFAPLLGMALVMWIVFIIKSSWFNRLLRKLSEPTVYYQPPSHSSQQSTTPARQPDPALGFDLTAQEYQQLTKRYQQGYQPQTSQPPVTNSKQWSPFTPPQQRSQPKEDNPKDYEQPQAHYPEQMPPPMV